MTMEPMDKWRSGENFEQVGLSFKDALLNKGRLERERKQAARKAARRARWKQSRLRTWIWRVIGLIILVVIWGQAVTWLGQGG
jgi:hypothetical protein